MSLDRIGDFPGPPEAVPSEELPSARQEAPAKSEPFQYSAESPVQEISPKELDKVARGFIDDVQKYATDSKGEPVAAPPSKFGLKYDPRKLAPSYQSARKDQKEAAQRWNERREATKHRTNEHRQDDTFRRRSPAGDAKTFSYDLGNGHSAALMALRNFAHSTRVEHLAAHPGTSGAGETMIEKAVNESQTRGNNGEVVLESAGPAKDFYRSLGFKEDGLLDMKLNPSERPDLWSKNEDGTWSLTKHKDKGYLKAEDSSPDSSD